MSDFVSACESLAKRFNLEAQAVTDLIKEVAVVMGTGGSEKESRVLTTHDGDNVTFMFHANGMFSVFGASKASYVFEDGVFVPLDGYGI